MPFFLTLLFQFPKILIRILLEHQQLKKIIKKHNIDVVISDNRFGLWCRSVKSIYITHQIMIKCPKHLVKLEKVLYKIHKWIINKYSECWIPDFEGTPNLSGDLSHKYAVPKNTIFIGPLSRISHANTNDILDFDVLFLLSGPEPQRTVFEEIITKSILNTDRKIAIIRGITDQDKDLNVSHYVINYANNNELEKTIRRSKLIISRSGYSTIMDLAAMSKKAVFIPTPGQTEQEYLAEYLFTEGHFYYMRQDEFSLETAITEAEKFAGIFAVNDYDILTERICLL